MNLTDVLGGKHTKIDNVIINESVWIMNHGGLEMKCGLVVYSY